MVSTIDLIIILFLFSFGFFGFFFGFIRAVGSLLAVVIGVWVASNYYFLLFDPIREWFLGYDTSAKVFAYVIMFAIVNRLLILGFGLLDSTFNLLSIIPFMRTFNRLGGGLLGLFEGSFLLSIILLFITRHADFPLIGSWAAGTLSMSKMTPFFLKIGVWADPFLPAIINKVTGAI